MEPGPRTPQSSPSFVLPSLVLSHPRLILARLQTADMISMVQGASIVGPPVPKAVVTTKKPTSTKKAVAEGGLIWYVHGLVVARAVRTTVGIRA